MIHIEFDINLWEIGKALCYIVGTTITIVILFVWSFRNFGL